MNVTKLQTIRRVGSVPGCLMLGAADVGVGRTCDDDNKLVFFAWGVNWTEQEAKESGLPKIAMIGKVWDCEGGRLNYSPIIPKHIVEKLLPLVLDLWEVAETLVPSDRELLEDV